MRSEIQTVDQPKASFIETARRAQIIDCAIEAIADLGFAQASLAQIAKRAGVSTGVILYYFASKDDLIRAVGAHVFAVGEAFMRPLVNRETTATAALRAFIEASVAFIAANRKNAAAVMGIIRAGQAENGPPHFDQAVAQARRSGFQQILEWGQRSGEFRTFSVPIMADTIIEALDLIPQRIATEPSLDLDAYATELVALFDRATRTDPPSQEPAIP